MEVMMPVECVCEDCISCPELELDVTQLAFNSGDSSWVSNRIRCTKARRCEHLKKFLQKNLTKEEKENGGN